MVMTRSAFSSRPDDLVGLVPVHPVAVLAEHRIRMLVDRRAQLLAAGRRTGNAIFQP
jgi:hypothetical protein